jgi:ligand-binding sensor domain-containing protein/signal transduction histidine kinase
MRTRLAVAVLSLAVSAFGLDPNRRLTQYVHRIWQTQQGLAESTVYSVIQTRDGYLWLGTQAGLVRFDGVGFTPVESIYASAPTNIWVRDLVQDQHGAIWIGTNESGIYRLEHGSFTHFSQKDGLPSDSISTVLEGRNGEIWAGTSNGLARFADGKIQAYRESDGLGANLVRSAFLAADGTLWAGGDGPRISQSNGTRFVARTLTSLPADSGIRAISGSKDGTLWIGTNVGLVRLKDGQEKLYTTKDGLVDNWILDLFESRDGSLWIGTRAGFSRIRNGELESFRPQDGLSQSTVYSVFEDREGSLWVGTKHGLNQFLDGRGIPYTVNEGLPSNDTGPVLQDRSGTIWIGTLGSGLTRFDGRRFTTLTTRDGLASNFVNALAEDADGNLLVGTNHGLNRVKAGHVEPASSSADVRSLFRDRSGKIWTGTTRGGEPVVAQGEDAGGHIYLSTASGVFTVSGEPLLQNGVPLRGVSAFYRDPEGGLWMGTLGNGLRLLEDGKISSFFMRDGLFDSEIYGIAGDNDGRLWMACSKGIYAVSRAELRKFAAGAVKQITSNPYSPTDALRVIESKPGVQPAVSLMKDGRLWFSTIRGIIVLDPHWQRFLPPPPVVIEDVTVNGEREQPGRIATLAPGRKNIEFTYTGLSLVLPNRITFKYILEGFDKKWIEAGTRREANYTNLPPGKYHFRVSACNIDGVCNEAGDVVDFVLAPHYYQQIWFWPLVAALIGASIWAGYKLRIRRLREQFGLILTERNRIARELHDTLIQGLSGITMEMQALAGRIKAPEERSTLEDIIQDAGTCLRETRRSVAGLRSGNSGLAAAIEQAARQITETKDVKLRLKLENKSTGLAPDVEYNLLRIAQEAVTNSVKHSGARTVEVALDYSARTLRLQVKDDGSGFAENGNGTTGHYGLIGMKERASHIGAALELASAPGRGTTISVVLPNGHNGNHE